MPLPGKLIIMVLVLAAVITLIGFNWGYTSAVSLVFYEFQNVPIIITIGISFLAGALFAIPYAVRSTLQHKRKQVRKIEKKQEFEEKNRQKLLKRNKKQRKGKTGSSEDGGSPAVQLPDVPPEEK
jgi:uncharacterized integral membrane protein